MRLVIEKSRKKPAASPQMGFDFSSKRESTAKPTEAPRPAGTGWQAIPGGKQGGFRKPASGGGYTYWYPDSGPVASAKPAAKTDRRSRLQRLLQASKLIQQALKLVHDHSHGWQAALQAAKRAGGAANEDYRILGSPKRQAELEGLLERLDKKPAKAAEVTAVHAQGDVAPPPVKLVVESPPKELGSAPGGKYETTGYVYGSRAEMWKLRSGGESLDPSMSYDLVTREQVLGGSVKPSSFSAEQAAGTEPAAAYMKYRLLKSIQARPADSDEMRSAFVQSIGLLQQGLADCRSVNDVNMLMQEWEDQAAGRVPGEVVDEAELKKRGYWGMFAPRPTMPAVDRADPERDAKISAWMSGPEMKAWRDGHHEANSQMLKDNAGSAYTHKLSGGRVMILKSATSEQKRAALARFESLGKGFQLLFGRKMTEGYYGKSLRRASGTTTERKFQAEVRSIAESGSWAWTGPAPKPRADGSTKRTKTTDYRAILSQRRMGDVVREGGRELTGGIGPVAMKKELGLKEVEYGKWLSGKTSGEERQWHTEAAHAALMDMSDVLGVSPQEIGLNGRVGLGFGSRGTGRASAHYEPSTHIINLTKFSGKGSLAHEWGHAMDHIIHLSNNPEVGKPTFPSAQAARGGDMGSVPQEVQAAVRGVMDTIMWEDARGGDARSELKSRMAQTKSEYKAASGDEREALRRDFNAQVKSFNAMGKSSAGYRVPTEFHLGAGAMGKYWVMPEEMFARCFEAHVSDSLEKNKQKNTYLVDGVDHMPDVPGFYPGGEHRQKIGAAIDRLMSTLRDSKQFQKALASEWLDGLLKSTDWASRP